MFGFSYSQECSSISIRDFELLRLRLWERDGDLEGLRDTYLDPASDGVRLLLREPNLWEREGLLRALLLLWLLLLLPSSLPLSFSLSPSIAASNRLLRGPMSPFSSRTCLFIRRGIMMSQTLSSLSNSYTNSSIKSKEYPARGKIRQESNVSTRRLHMFLNLSFR